MTNKLLILLLCFTVHTAVANDQIPAPPQTKPIALMNGTVHTVSGGDISGGDVLFINGKIKAVGKNITLPQDVVKIDITGKHVYPGLIALNTNLGLSEIEAVRATRDKRETGSINPNVRAEAAFNPDSELIPVARANGIAVAQSMPMGGLVSGLSAMMMMDGWTWEDMTLKAPLGLHINWPSMGFDRDSGSSKDRRDGRIQQIKDTITEARAYWKAREANPAAHDTDSRWEALKPVLDGDAQVMIHADDIREIQASVTWALDEGLKPVLVGGRDSWRITEWLKKRDIPVIVYSADTLSFRAWEPFDTGFTLPKKLFEAGVKFAYGFPPYGNSGDNAILRNLPYHVAKAVSYGLPKDEGLKAITLYPAQIMGIADRVGSIETGKDATIIVTDGDPLEIPTQVEKMYIQGRDVDLTSRHTMLYEKYKTKYEQQAQ